MTIIGLQKEAIIIMHNMLLLKYGGPKGLRDEGLLESALGRPINQYYYEHNTNIFSLVTAYAFGIIQNHPFVDGNKRTAFVAVKTLQNLTQALAKYAVTMTS